MVSTATIISMFVPIIFAFVLFIGMIIMAKKKIGIEMRALVLGAVGFFVFSQVLEKALHVVVISQFPDYADHPVWFGLYGGFAAGIFEEMGRFILFIWLLKKFRSFKSGISFGIGWGGIEAILLTLMIVVPNIIFAFMINSGVLESTIGKDMPAETLETLKAGVLNHGVSFYLLACVERLSAVFMQLAFSLLVLLGVKKGKFAYVLYAIIIHAAVDFPLVFVQTGYFNNLWLVELYVAILGVLGGFFMKKMQKKFTDEQMDSETDIHLNV
ncbi:YhfC family intramembrane metalloprotease [Falsibacillus albus]|uniref:YhfC family intramembrane metalloprotease n=1 Tax=Falsibacillus albus TaxID=2478915 RepID=A0A3L7JSU8_9BACI|nr:YhfC family intramembrane metalloprotease [Falsibacillus albus]RLQ93119.1 YhfC family intramembrane metalloprotease [Falsibacillus albus]